MSTDELEQAAHKLVEAAREGDDDTLLALARSHGERIALTALAFLDMKKEAVYEGLGDEERDFLLKAFQNATEGTPRLTELENEQQLEAAKVLSERGLMTFTSIPSFVLISKRGLRYVEKFEKQARKQ
jgi:hypothetical protein